jgi:protein phosphatase
MGLYVVADGMGGHKAGEVASKLVVETMRDYIDQNQDDEQSLNLVDSDEKISEEAQRLLASIHLSNRIVHQTALSNEDYKGMGSTVSAVYFTENGFHGFSCLFYGENPYCRQCGRQPGLPDSGR